MRFQTLIGSKKDATLYIAAEEGHWKIVQCLLSYGTVVFFDPGKIKELLQHYSSKMMNNKILQGNVSAYEYVLCTLCKLQSETNQFKRISKHFIHEKIWKQDYFLTCILPDYVSHEILEVMEK